MRYVISMLLLATLFTTSLFAQNVDGVNTSEALVVTGATNDIPCYASTGTLGPCDTGDFFFNSNLLILDQAAHAIVFGVDPADAGTIRLPNAAIIGWEADAAGTDVSLTVNSSEAFVFNDGDDLVLIGGAQTMIVEDATASTGNTKLAIQEGAGDSASDILLEFRANNDAAVAGFANEGKAWVNIATTADLTITPIGGGNANGLHLTTKFDLSGTSGTQSHFKMTDTVGPSSGTAIFNIFHLATTTNQTGGANGIVRLFYIEPTVTAAADLRGIEIGDVGAGHTALKTGTGAVVLGDKLSAEPGGSVSAWKKYTVAAAALTTVSATEDEVLFNLPANGLLCGVRVKHSLAFSGGTSSAMTVSVGDSTSTTLYTSAFDIFQAVAAATAQWTDMVKASTSVARDVLGRFTVTGDTMDNVTAGSVDVHVCWVVLP